MHVKQASSLSTTKSRSRLNMNLLNRNRRIMNHAKSGDFFFGYYTGRISLSSSEWCWLEPFIGLLRSFKRTQRNSNQKTILHPILHDNVFHNYVDNDLFMLLIMFRSILKTSIVSHLKALLEERIICLEERRLQV